MLKNHELYQTLLILCVHKMHIPFAYDRTNKYCSNKFATELKVFVQAEQIIGQSRAKYLPLQSRVFVREVELDLRGTSNLITRAA